MSSNIIIKALAELGLISLWSSPIDTKLLCLQRFTRMFAYGSSTLILVSYLSALDIPKPRIGLFMTLTLIGGTVLSFILTIFADGVGRRAILLLGAFLMAFSGVVFALVGNYWVLLAAAVVGVISPSGNEIGPFRAIEESTIAHLTPEAIRGDIYAWYSLLGAAGSAFGMGLCGWLLDFLLKSSHWSVIKAYRVVFWVYAGLGAIMFCLVLCLSKGCEADPLQPKVDIESASIQSDDKAPEEKKNYILAKLPSFSQKSKMVLIKLCFLFAIESFGSNLAPLTWVTFFFREKFGLQDGQLGMLFFVTTIIAATSMLGAASVAKRLGNIKTMVFAHLPSAIFLALIPASTSAPVSITFLVLRSCTQSMDTPPRSAFLASVVAPSERTAMMGFVNIARSSVSSFSPMIVGVLAGENLLWVAFVTAGCLLVSYDLGILAVFGGSGKVEVYGEEKEEVESERDSDSDGEVLAKAVSGKTDESIREESKDEECSVATCANEVESTIITGNVLNEKSSTEMIEQKELSEKGQGSHDGDKHRQ